MSTSRTLISQRLAQLKGEYEEGQKMMADWKSKMANLEKTMLRISGAIQALEELLEQLSEPAGNVIDGSSRNVA